MPARLNLYFCRSVLQYASVAILLILTGCARQPDPEFVPLSKVTMGTDKDARTTEVPQEIEKLITAEVITLTGHSPGSLKMLGAQPLGKSSADSKEAGTGKVEYPDLDKLHELFKPLHDDEDVKYEEEKEGTYEEIEELRERYVALEELRNNYLQVVWRGKFDVKRMAKGRAIYTKRCVQCHGFSGDGNGPQAKHLYPQPRDYRKGKFKFKSTSPRGSKALHSDLVRTVTRGVTGTSMPAFERLRKDDIEAVVDYVLALTHRGELEEKLSIAIVVEEGLEIPEEPASDADDEAKLEYKEELADFQMAFTTEKIRVLENILSSWTWDPEHEGKPLSPFMPLSSQPRFTREHVKRGKILFKAIGCEGCHNKNGRGLDAGYNKFDDWNVRTIAADLTSGIFHGGEEPIDIYRRVYVGIDGTPMPSGFKSDKMKTAMQKNPELVWDLVAYVLSLSEKRRRGEIPPAGLYDRSEKSMMRDRVQKQDTIAKKKKEEEK